MVADDYTERGVSKVGRVAEQKKLAKAMSSNESEFVAVYGRRRIGKTYLVREFFKGKFLFQHTGIEKGNFKRQLSGFRDSLVDCGYKGCPMPDDWTVAFRLLKELIERSRQTRKVIFIDEMPWMDTPRSEFVSALEHFWNAWMSARKDVVLVVCGSATSWIINKVIRSRGGLHNRVTETIPLAPFTLAECEAYAVSRGLRLGRSELAELFMVFGGVAYYWRMLEKGKSVAQNVDRLLFAKDGELRGEFDRVFASLFKNDEAYRRIVLALSGKQSMTRDELLGKLGDKEGGRWTHRLEELEQCGFIRRYSGWGKKERESTYQLTDNFSLFHLRFIRGESNPDEHFWQHATTLPAISVWRGFAFERLCLEHIRQIKDALGISGVLTKVYSWRHVPDEEYTQGAQIDLVIERADNLVNVCEMKFSAEAYVITKRYAAELATKIGTFRDVEKIRKGIHLTFITAAGLLRNSHSGIVQSEVTLDDLFRA